MSIEWTIGLWRVCRRDAKSASSGSYAHQAAEWHCHNADEVHMQTLVMLLVALAAGIAAMLIALGAMLRTPPRWSRKLGTGNAFLLIRKLFAKRVPVSTPSRSSCTVSPHCCARCSCRRRPSRNAVRGVQVTPTCLVIG